MAESLEEAEANMGMEEANRDGNTSEYSAEMAQKILAAHFDGFNDDVSLEELNAEYTILLGDLSKCKGHHRIQTIDSVCMYIHQFDISLQLQAIDDLVSLFKSADESVKLHLNDHFITLCETVANTRCASKILSVILEELYNNDEQPEHLVSALNKTFLSLAASHPSETLQGIATLISDGKHPIKILEFLQLWIDVEKSATRSRNELWTLCRSGKGLQSQTAKLEEEGWLPITEVLGAFLNIWKGMGGLGEEVASEEGMGKPMNEAKDYDGEDDPYLLDSLVFEDESDEEGAIEEDEIPFTRIPDVNEPSCLLEFYHLPPTLDINRFRQVLERYGEVIRIERMDDRPLHVQFKTVECAAIVKSSLDGKRIKNRVIQVVFAKREIGSIVGSSEGFRLLRSGVSIMRGAMQSGSLEEINASMSPQVVSMRTPMMSGRVALPPRMPEGVSLPPNYPISASQYPSGGPMFAYPPNRPSRPIRPNLQAIPPSGGYLPPLGGPPPRGYGYMGGYPMAPPRGAVLRPPPHPYHNLPPTVEIVDVNDTLVPSGATMPMNMEAPNVATGGATGVALPVGNSSHTSTIKARLTPRDSMSYPSGGDLYASVVPTEKVNDSKIYREKLSFDARLQHPVSNWSEDQSIDEQMEDYRRLVKRFAFVNRYLLLQNLPSYLQSEEAVQKWVEEALQDSEFEVEMLIDSEKKSVAHLTFKTKKNAVEAYKKFRESDEGVHCEHAPPRKANNCLWLGNVRECMSSTDVKNMFEQFGKLSRWKFLPEKTCGFVAYENIQDAITARNHLFGVLGSKEICLNVDFSPGDSTVEASNRSHTSAATTLRGDYNTYGIRENAARWQPLNEGGTRQSFNYMHGNVMYPPSVTTASASYAPLAPRGASVPYGGSALPGMASSLKGGPPPLHAMQQSNTHGLQPTLLQPPAAVSPGTGTFGPTIDGRGSFIGGGGRSGFLPSGGGAGRVSTNDLSVALLDLLANPEMLELARERILATSGGSKSSSHSKRYSGLSGREVSSHHRRSRTHSRERRRSTRTSSAQKPIHSRHIYNSPHSNATKYSSTMNRRRSDSAHTVSVSSREEASSEKEVSHQRINHSHHHSLHPTSNEHSVVKRNVPNRSFGNPPHHRGRKSQSDSSRDTPTKRTRRSQSPYDRATHADVPSASYREHRRTNRMNAFGYRSSSKASASKYSKTDGLRESISNSITSVVALDSTTGGLSVANINNNAPHALAPPATTGPYASPSFRATLPLEDTNYMPYSSGKVNGDSLLLVCKVTKQGGESCNMSAKYIKGNFDMKPESELNVGQRTQLDRLRSHLKKTHKYSLWQLGADTRSDSRHYDELCDYFIKKDRVGLVESETVDVYLVPPNVNYVEPLDLPDANFLYAFVLEKCDLQ